jgi:leader peptidase (prepilin peptidase) / N-methyltransferase
LLANIQNYFCTLPEAVFGAVIGYLILWSLVKLFYVCTGKVGMGHGDFKLFAALGAWFGVFLLPFMLLLASVTGIIGGLVYLKYTHQSKDTPIAFGPFLCLTGFITLFYGNSVLTWYLGL